MQITDNDLYALVGKLVVGSYAVERENEALKAAIQQANEKGSDAPSN